MNTCCGLPSTRRVDVLLHVSGTREYAAYCESTFNLSSLILFGCCAGSGWDLVNRSHVSPPRVKVGGESNAVLCDYVVLIPSYWVKRGNLAHWGHSGRYL